MIQIFESALPYIWGGTVLFSVGMVLKLLNSDKDSTAKMTWLLIMLAMPVSLDGPYSYFGRAFIDII